MERMKLKVSTEQKIVKETISDVDDEILGQFLTDRIKTKANNFTHTLLRYMLASKKTNEEKYKVRDLFARLFASINENFLNLIDNEDFKRVFKTSSYQAEELLIRFTEKIGLLKLEGERNKKKQIRINVNDVLQECFHECAQKYNKEVDESFSKTLLSDIINESNERIVHDIAEFFMQKEADEINKKEFFSGVTPILSVFNVFLLFMEKVNYAFAIEE